MDERLENICITQPWSRVMHQRGCSQLGCDEDLAGRFVYAHESHAVWVIGPLQRKYLIATSNIPCQRYQSERMIPNLVGYRTSFSSMLSVLFSMIFNATDDPVGICSAFLTVAKLPLKTKRAESPIRDGHDRIQAVRLLSEGLANLVD